MTIQISEPQNYYQRSEIRKIVKRECYRKGTDPYIFCEVMDYEEPRLKIIALNQIPGVKAKVFREYDSLPEAQTRP